MATLLFDSRRTSSLRNFPLAGKKIAAARMKLFKTNSVPQVESSTLDALAASAPGSAPAMDSPQGAPAVGQKGPPQTPGSGTPPAGAAGALSNSTQTLAVSSTPRSLSLASISSEGSAESHIVEQEDIVALSTAVRSFKEALGKLRRIFNPDRDKSETLRVAAHERLGEVLRVLKSILETYSPIQHNELLSAASRLISNVNGYNYEEENADSTEFLESIDQLALAFSSRVSEYLMGDIETAAHNCSTSSSRTKSCDNLLSSDTESITGTQEKSVICPSLPSGGSEVSIKRDPESYTTEDLDGILQKHENGVDHAMYRAKAWARYAKDIITFVEKRAQLDAEYARSLAKIVQSIRPSLKEESFLPFQSIYFTALDQELENCNSITATSSLLQTQKFVEPLTFRRNEHERARKTLKETWHRELKRATEAVAHLKKCRANYIQKHQVRDAAMAYKMGVDDANDKHSSLLKAKRNVIQQIRNLTIQSDQTMKAATIAYFQMQHTVAGPAPVQLQTLCESSRLYEPGSQYLEFIKQLGPSPNQDPVVHPYVFEPYTPGRLDRTVDPICATNGSTTSSEDFQLSGRLPLQAGSDTDSVGSSRSAKSGGDLADISPTTSPLPPTKKSHNNNLSSGEELDLETDADGIWTGRRQVMSKAAVTHAFRKLKTPSRCRECDSYVYFHGYECAECGLSCHKKCLETLAIQCGHKRLPRKMTTFGVDLAQHLEETNASVPHLILKCVSEIDSRGIGIKGIYRVSGLKSRVEKLCQAFENGAHLVDLTDQNPNVIANVLKLYLRQLPEPLLSCRLYSDLIRLAKEYPSNGTIDNAKIVEDLRDVVCRLPRHHLHSLAVLMHHLYKVASYAYINNMPPSNLGIVFGPTLLRTSEGSASLSSLVDTVHQTRAIELLIMFSQDIFPPLEQILPQTLHLNVVPSATSSPHHSPSVLRSPQRQIPAAFDPTVKLKGGSEDLVRQTTVIAAYGASIRHKGDKDMIEDEWEWEVDETTDPSSDLPTGAVPGPHVFARLGSNSSSSSSGSGNASTTKIVKTSLKDYVGLELAALQKIQAQPEPESFFPHQKLRKTLSEQPPGVAEPVPCHRQQESLRKPHPDEVKHEMHGMLHQNDSPKGKSSHYDDSFIKRLSIPDDLIPCKPPVDRRNLPEPKKVKSEQSSPQKPSQSFMEQQTSFSKMVHKNESGIGEAEVKVEVRTSSAVSPKYTIADCVQGSLSYEHSKSAYASIGVSSTTPGVGVTVRAEERQRIRAAVAVESESRQCPPSMHSIGRQPLEGGTSSDSSSQDLDSAHATEDSEPHEETLPVGSFRGVSLPATSSENSSSSGVCGSLSDSGGSPYLNRERLTLGPSLVVTRSTIEHYDSRRTVTAVVSSASQRPFDENRLRIQVPGLEAEPEDDCLSSGGEERIWSRNDSKGRAPAEASKCPQTRGAGTPLTNREPRYV